MPPYVVVHDVLALLTHADPWQFGQALPQVTCFRFRNDDVKFYRHIDIQSLHFVFTFSLVPKQVHHDENDGLFRIRPMHHASPLHAQRRSCCGVRSHFFRVEFRS